MERQGRQLGAAVRAPVMATSRAVHVSFPIPLFFYDVNFYDVTGGLVKQKLLSSSRVLGITVYVLIRRGGSG